MKYIQSFYEREFKAKGSKEAYLKACKFVASNIISDSSKVEASKVTWSVTRVKTEDEESLPTFLLTLFYTFDDTEFMEKTCTACKEFHKSFFINENFNCDRCNKIGYERNIKQKLAIGSEYFKKRLSDELDML